MCLLCKVKKKLFKKCDFFLKSGRGGGIVIIKYRFKVCMYVLSYFDLFC